LPDTDTVEVAYNEASARIAMAASTM